MQLFDKLGLTINREKSVLTPVQTIEYLGFELNSNDMTVALTKKKIVKLRPTADHLLRQDQITIHDLASFVGTLVAADLGVRNAPLYYNGLEIVRNAALAENYGNYNAKIQLCADTKNEIQWQANNIMATTNPVHTPRERHKLQSDASKRGWRGGGYTAVTPWEEIGQRWRLRSTSTGWNCMQPGSP